MTMYMYLEIFQEWSRLIPEDSCNAVTEDSRKSSRGTWVLNVGWVDLRTWEILEASQWSSCLPSPEISDWSLKNVLLMTGSFHALLKSFTLGFPCKSSLAMWLKLVDYTAAKCHYFHVCVCVCFFCFCFFCFLFIWKSKKKKKTKFWAVFFWSGQVFDPPGFHASWGPRREIFHYLSKIVVGQELGCWSELLLWPF